jgi:hypothetical protein
LQEFEPIGDFMVDLQKHNSLQEAKNDAIPFGDKTVDISDVPCVDFEIYSKLKGYRSSLEPFT